MGQQMDKASRIATVASEGDVKHVRKSSSGAGGIDVRSQHGSTALMLAVEHKHPVAVRTLLDAGAEVNTRELSHTLGRSVLMLGIEVGATHCVDILLQNGAEVNYSDTGGQTAVMYAVKNDKVDCLQALVRAKANLDKGDSLGMTATMLAVKSGHLRCLELLLQAGADLNVADSTGQTCLMHAVRDGTPGGFKSLQLLLQTLPQSRLNVDQTDQNGLTALMHCVRYGNVVCLQELLRAGAGVDVRDILGRTSLMLAAETRSLKFNHEVQLELINSLIDARANLNIRDYDGKTALLHSVEDDVLSPVSNILRARGADVNIADKQGVTLLMLAVKKISDTSVFLKFLRDLLKNDANLDSFDKWGKTALVHSLELKEPTHEKAVSLLQMGANPHVGRHQQVPCSPFFSCALQKNFEKGSGERISFLRYFIASNFLTNVDLLGRLSMDNQTVQFDPEAKMLLQKVYSNPWPLSKLALLAVSSAIGPNPGRDWRVKQTKLPPRIQNLLLFQDPISQLPPHHWQNIPICLDAFEYEHLPTPRPLILHWPFGRELVKCYCKKCQGRSLNFHGV